MNHLGVSFYIKKYPEMIILILLYLLIHKLKLANFRDTYMVPKW